MSQAHASITEGHERSEGAHYDPLGAKIGMWLFLFTEVLLFGTLFMAFAVYLRMYRTDFMNGSGHLDKLFGAANTAILLTSSLTMALAIAALERGKKAFSLGLMGFTLLCAAAFLGIKAQEWGHKFASDLYPNSETMLAKPYGEQLFYGLYYAMTGLHALHVIIGGLVIVSAMILVAKDKVRPGHGAYLDNTGLYWHLVDMVWIYLFPLFYLIGGHH